MFLLYIYIYNLSILIFSYTLPVFAIFTILTTIMALKFLLHEAGKRQ